MSRLKLTLKFKKHPFIKDALALIGGNTWAQAINIIAYVVLARIYSPQDFGLYNIFFSYIEVLVILSTCKYEMAIVLADSDRQAAAVSRLALRLNTIVSCVLLAFAFLLCTVAKYTNGMQISAPSFQLLILLIPPMVFFCGTTRVYTHLFNRFRKFNQIALSEMVGATSGVAFKILLGLPRLATTAIHSCGLALGTVLGRVAANINYLLNKSKLNLPKEITRDEQRDVARRYRNFPLYTMPKDLINSFSYNLPFLWLAFYFDKAEVGLFAMAMTCSFRPVNVFNNAFEKLMYVRVVEKVHAHQPIMDDLKRFFRIVCIAALPFFVVAFLFGDSILGFLLGGRWSQCGYYLRCLLPWVFVQLTSTSLMFIPNVFSRQRGEFLFYLLLLLLRVISVIVGIATMDFRLSILLFSMSGMVVSAALLIWYFSLARHYQTEGL